MPATQNQPSLTDNEGRRIHQSWANAGEVALAIMRGDHDEYLSQIQSAAAARVKGMWRKGTRVNIVGSKNADDDTGHAQCGVCERTMDPGVGCTEAKALAREHNAVYEEV